MTGRKNKKGIGVFFLFISSFLFLLLPHVAHSAPGISAAPSANDCGVVNLGSTSAIQTVTVTNTGDTDLSIGTVNISGTSSGEFYLTDDNCSGQTIAPTIAPSTACDVGIVLAPIVSGMKDVDINIPSNAPTLYVPVGGEGSTQEEFSDVPESHWADDYINTLYYNGVATGYGDGTYRPLTQVNRAQMAIFIIRALYGDNFSYGSTPYFPDVPDTHWAFKYIQRMYEEGIATGYGDGTYGPSIQVNRAQMAIFIIRALYGDDFSYGSTPYFPDVPDTHWAFKYIQKMNEEGIATGYGDGTYRPSNVVNRAQMAIFITRGFLIFIIQPVIDVTPASYDYGDIMVGSASAGQSFSISNNGTADLNVNDILLSGGDSAEFILDLNGGTNPCASATPVIGPGAHCTVSVIFVPSSEGPMSADLSISSDAPVNPLLNIPLNGIGDSNIHYIPINLNSDGNTYSGSLSDESVGSNPAQRFYSVTRPAACTSMMQIAIAGTGPANPDMLVSNSDFSTSEEALTLYQDFLNTTGYEVNTEVTIGGDTYWYWFAASFESEYVPIFPPSDSTYYIEVVNADNISGIFRIEAHCQ
jgi:hypothetical protein